MGRTRAGNTGANKQPGLLSVRSALVRSQVRGEGGRGEGGERGGGGDGGTTRSRGIELRGRSYAGVFSHSVRTGVICALGWLSPGDTAALCHATYGLFIQAIKHRAV